MAQITSRGRIPLLVGGTMLYFRALAGGLAVLPPADARVRAALEREAAELGWAALHQRLREVDPTAAARIHPNDPQRIQRALEVITLTGRSMTELQSRTMVGSFDYRVLRLVVCPDSRTELHRRINLRFEQMLQLGLEDEVRGLMRRGDLQASLPSMRCVGYRQVWSQLQGEITRPEMVLKGQAATRQLAKRQLTWLRQESEALWYDLQREEARKKVQEDFDRFLES
jgi:tRNA dimethylallyltransferase